MSEMQQLLSIASGYLAGLAVSKFGTKYKDVATAAIALVVSVVVLVVSDYPQYQDTVTMVLRVLVAVLGALGVEKVTRAGSSTARALLKR